MPLQPGEIVYTTENLTPDEARAILAAHDALVAAEAEHRRLQAISIERGPRIKTRLAAVEAELAAERERMKRLDRAWRLALAEAGMGDTPADEVARLAELDACRLAGSLLEVEAYGLRILDACGDPVDWQADEAYWQANALRGTLYDLCWPPARPPQSMLTRGRLLEADRKVWEAQVKHQHGRQSLDDVEVKHQHDRQSLGDVLALARSVLAQSDAPEPPADRAEYGVNGNVPDVDMDVNKYV